MATHWDNPPTGVDVVPPDDSPPKGAAAKPRATTAATKAAAAARSAASSKAGAEPKSPAATRTRRAPRKKSDSGKLPPPDPKPALIRNLRSPEWYLNRELTWLSFNTRVLHEAQDKRVPLLERVKFLAIVSSNMDEFFMKRIGGLKHQVGAGVHDLTVDGRTPLEQIVECVEAVRNLQKQSRKVFLSLIEELRKHDVVVDAYDRLSADQREKIRAHYQKNVLPLVTPLAMDPAHPFPFISNLSLNLLVTLHHFDEAEAIMARVKVPVGSGVPRLLRVGEDNHFVLLEDVMAHNLDLLFPGMDVESCELFRVTRNANTEKDEEQADDLLAMIEAELRDRKFSTIVRLQVGKGMDSTHRGMLTAELGLDAEIDVHEVDVMIGMRDLMELVGLDLPELHDADHHPINNVRLQDSRNIFHIIRETGPILLHHPYESFTSSVERFVREASRDPKVLAIKMILYRTSADTRIIEYLIDAARDGKQVAVVVELKARFDEAANIKWASHLEEVGIHVTYGVVGLKTHAKAILVVRQDYNGLHRYAHVGTGNYHAGTARLYSDLGMLTCDDAIGEDLTELFNYLTTGCKPSRKYNKVLTAPKMMKKALLANIDREIEIHSERTPGLIRFKTNALEDADIVEALYRASQGGVKVDLLVRDTCRLRPGIPGLSENITVLSIVGRFLEHSRVYYFRNGGDEEYFMGSADLMKRNLGSRVEIITPIDDPGLRRDLRKFLDHQIADQRCAWEMQSDGTFIQRQPPVGSNANGCQQELITAADKRNFDANRLRKRKARPIPRRAVR